MHKSWKRTAPKMAAVICMLCIIWGHSLMPPQVSGAESGWIAAFLQQWIPWDSLEFFIRKLAHFSEFAVFGAALFLCLCDFFGCRPQCAANTLFGGLLTAVADEFIQLFSGRGSAVADVVLDFSGCIAGTMLCFMCVCLWRRTHRKPTGKSI